MTTAADWINADTSTPDVPDTPTTPVVDVPAEGPAAPAVPAEAPTPATPPDTPTEVEELIEAMLDGQAQKLSAKLQIPWKNKAGEGTATLKDLVQSPMFHADYSRRMNQLASERKAWEAEQSEKSTAFERDRIAFEKRRELYEQEQKNYIESRGDPEKFAAWEQHRSMYETDPEYRRRWDRAIDADVNDALQEYDETREVEQYSRSVAADARAYLTEQASKYPGVDVNVIAQRYAEQWYALDRITDPEARSARERELVSSRSIDQLFAEEQTSASRVSAPLRSELDELKKELAALKAERTAESHNTKTAEQLARAKAPRVAVPAGTAPAVPGKPTLDPNLRGEDRVKAWVNAA